MQENLYNMIADYMEKGFLDNIIDMFKYDPEIHPVAQRLVGDERMRVRLGAIALLETLSETAFVHLNEIADSIIPLLKSENTLVRGDAAYSLGIIGSDRHIPQLQGLLNDETPDVVESAMDSIEAIHNRTRCLEPEERPEA
ncbi:MAG: HEAT repeat domain-containing protein [Nitrospirae bacterium]|nr:HEAT repeat domain-containing protein [Nitrospirota bacterium]